MKRYTLETVVFDDGSITTSVKHANSEIHLSVSRLSDDELNVTVVDESGRETHQLVTKPFGPTAQDMILKSVDLLAMTIVRNYEADFKGKFGAACPWCGSEHPQVVEGTVVGGD